MRRVRVFPLDRASVGRVSVDVTTKFTGQIGDRGEDAAGNDRTFDFGEPEFDLVEPRRIGRREVKPHPRMPLQEIAHRLGFMGGEVVEDDVNLLPGGHNDTTSSRKATNSRLVWRAAVFPCTRPVLVFSAAYRESVP